MRRTLTEEVVVALIPERYLVVMDVFELEIALSALKLYRGDFDDYKGAQLWQNETSRAIDAINGALKIDNVPRLIEKLSPQKPIKEK